MYIKINYIFIGNSNACPRSIAKAFVYKTLLVAAVAASVTLAAL